jgi:hypothetical protein
VTSSIDNRRVSQVAGFAQWTAFEAFGLPALALRFGGQRWYGMAFSEMTSFSSDLVLSYGFSIFSFYGLYGAGHHTAKLETSPRNEELFLAAGISDETTTSWTETSTAFGFRITVLPPFVSLSGEQCQGEGGTRLYSVKVSVGH